MQIIETLNIKYYGLSLWIWLIVVAAFIYCVYSNTNKLNTVPEKFGNSQKNIKLYNFNTTWCGWSIRLQPQWDLLTTTVKNDPSLSSVQVFDIKCDSDENKQLCQTFNVEGYPTIIIDVDGKRTVYNGDRTSDAILKFVKTL